MRGSLVHHAVDLHDLRGEEEAQEDQEGSLVVVAAVERGTKRAAKRK